LHNVVAVTDAELHVNTSRWFNINVHQAVVRKLGIGNNHAAVVEGGENGVKNLNFTHHARMTARLNGISHPEGFEHQNQHATGEVGQTALQGQADRETRSTQHGDE